VVRQFFAEACQVEQFYLLRGIKVVENIDAPALAVMCQGVMVIDTRAFASPLLFIMQFMNVLIQTWAFLLVDDADVRIFTAVRHSLTLFYITDWIFSDAVDSDFHM
jgi:hypothetical protein